MLASSTLALGLMLSALPAQRDFAQELGTHPYFSRIALERIESRSPYVFLIQKTGANDAERASILIQRYVQDLDPVRQLFEREIAGPLGLARREDRRLVVAVLASPGDLQNYAQVTGADRHFEGEGFYDPLLNAAVLNEDPFHVMRSSVELTRSIRHLFLHVCEQAWFAPGFEAPSESWILEALACELARRNPDDPDAPDAAVMPEASELRRFLLDLADERTRFAHGRTLEELCTVAEPGKLASFLEEHAGAGGPASADLEAATRAFQRQSALVLHFLLEGDERRYRDGCFAFLKQAFAGRADWSSCQASFAPANASELDGAFLAWALKQPAAASLATNGVTVDVAALSRALDRGANTARPAASPLDTPASAASAAPARETTPPRGPPTVPDLAPDLARATEEDRLALALHAIGRGRAQAGLTALDELMRSSNAAIRERVERERRRVVAWIELRDAFLRQRLESGQLIQFTYKGNELKTKVLGFADGELRLEKSRAPETLSPDAIDPLDLARDIEATGGPNDWVRVYPYVLQDDPRAKKLLRDDGGEAGALLGDLRNDYPARLRLGSLTARLEEIAWRPPATSPKEARAQLDELAAWRRDAEGSALLEQKRSALREHARSLLAREADSFEPKDLLRGKLVLGKDGGARLAYEFDDPRQLEDFSSEPYPVRATRALGIEQSGDVAFHVADGCLEASGQASLRSWVELGAPLTVRYSLEYVKQERAGSHCVCALGVCDDHKEHFLWTVGQQNLQCHDLRELNFTKIPNEPLVFGKPYALELRHDGAAATLLCDGKVQCSLDVGTRQAGAFFLCTSTDVPVRIERLEIEGRLTPSSFDGLKGAWIERELAKF